jgi:hypothetical protein
VVRVHLSVGLARHTGQRTDNVCLSDEEFKAHRGFPTDLLSTGLYLACPVESAAETGADPWHDDSLPRPPACAGCP